MRIQKNGNGTPSRTTPEGHVIFFTLQDFKRRAMGKGLKPVLKDKLTPPHCTHISCSHDIRKDTDVLFLMGRERPVKGIKNEYVCHQHHGEPSQTGSDRTRFQVVTIPEEEFLERAAAALGYRLEEMDEKNGHSNGHFDDKPPRPIRRRQRKRRRPVGA